MPSPPEPRRALPPQAARRDYAAEERINRELTLVAIQLRRGQAAEAEQAVTEILAQRPNDAAAHEMLGDIHLTRGNADGALAAYKAALVCDPKRATAETKMARATLRHSEQRRRRDLGVAYASSDTAWIGDSDVGSSKKTATVAVIGSLLVPGLGQFVRGEFVKAGIVLGIYVLCIIVFAITLPSYVSHTRAIHEKVVAIVVLTALVSAADWLYAVIDAARGARHRTKAPQPEKSGWEV